MTTTPAMSFMFAGQGAQYVGMGRDLYDRFETARAVFHEAEDVLGLPLRKLCFEGPESRLAETEITQPAILTVSIAALRAWEDVVEQNLQPRAAGGLSLGEYSALVAAGAIAFRDAVHLVHLRGRFMQQATPLGVGAMAASLGLPAAVVETLCAEVSRPGDFVEPANYNCPGQVVVAGHSTAVDRFAEAARAAGARKVTKLAVSAPFHCSLMQPAAEQLAPLLESLPIKQAAFPVVSNVDGQARRDPDDIRQALLKQVDHPVRWEECVRTLAELGTQTWVEIGPGRALSSFLRRIDRQATTVNIEDETSLSSAIAAVREAC